MSSANRYRIEITELENGFEVEIPDFAERKKRVEKAAKKDKSSGKMVDCCYSPYLGDCTKKYAVKSVAEVLKLVRGSLEQLPENEYQDEWDALAAAKKK